MNRKIQTTIKIALTAAFAAAIYVFYATMYRYHVHYHEQYQMFMFTGEYAAQVMGRPGGVADYISRFLVQFFISASWGAGIIAATLALLQGLTAWAMRARSLARYALSLVPAIAMWMALCDENGMVTTAIALIMAIAATIATDRVATARWRIATTAILTPILYILAGPIGLAYTLIVATTEAVGTRPGSKRSHRLIAAIALVAEAVACPLTAQYLVPYPLYRLVYGIGYFRYPFVPPTMAWITTACAFVVITVSLSMPAIKLRRQAVADIAAIAAVVAIATAGVRGSVDMNKEEVFGYDHMARNRQWNQIVSRAIQKHPDKPMSVAVLNLALAKCGDLSDHMFKFYQNGVEGLLPRFERDLTMPLVSAEIYYNLGMINSAQRFTFEAQEAIPDYQKSSRCYKRLAETHIINGDYEAARKYLKALQHTLFFDNWATKTLQLLDDEGAIDTHPEYGYLRQMRYVTDLLYSEDEMDSMLGRLFLDNQSNRMAFEYLVAWSLLNKDLERFYDCYVLGRDLGYDHIPKSYQEALALIWTMQHDTWQGLPWSLSPSVMQQMEQYIMDRRRNTPGISAKYAGTYWDYYFR